MTYPCHSQALSVEGTRTSAQCCLVVCRSFKKLAYQEFVFTLKRCFLVTTRRQYTPVPRLCHPWQQKTAHAHQGKAKNLVELHKRIYRLQLPVSFELSGTPVLVNYKMRGPAPGSDFETVDLTLSVNICQRNAPIRAKHITTVL